MRFYKTVVYFITLFAFALGVSGAVTTVTLTGTCPSFVTNSSNSYFNFSLYNSGNGVASDFVAEPLFGGFSTYNSTLSLQSLGPNSTYYFSFKLKNFTMPGSYVEAVIISYQQGGSSFATMYPCLTNVKKAANGLIIATSASLSDGKLNATMLNLANYTINGTVKVFAPPMFAVKPQYLNISVPPFGTRAVNFSMATPKYSNATIPIAISTSYEKDGLHYASIYTIDSIIHPSKVPLMSYTEIGIILIIAIVVVLIIFSVMRGKGKRTGKKVAAVENAVLHGS
ncbi:MAG: hypothetical protein M1360_02560 [Candidatus Marsarchaeota archaeon]|jgi:hypothetical protein|nr:hypothetical protein [Candidatus Marsarchaeota archaeon]MCL5418799.1 hypothetical protein [Candidatus Marsarchaeota archaeon]